jgi:hypothetical protein
MVSSTRRSAILTQQIAQFMSALNAASWTYGLIGVFGLILASVGLAGVTAYTVRRRAHEIGIRLALGAQKHDVLRLGCEGGRGTGGGWYDHWPRLRVGWNALAGWTFLFGSQRKKLRSGVTGRTARIARGCSIAACYLPARKCMRIDPPVALRKSARAEALRRASPGIDRLKLRIRGNYRETWGMKTLTEWVDLSLDCRQRKRPQVADQSLSKSGSIRLNPEPVAGTRDLLDFRLDTGDRRIRVSATPLLTNIG